MARRGRKRRLTLEDEYWQLILSGLGTVEACARLGIGRKTGYRWRAERGGIPPAAVAEAERSSRYLSLLERERIASLRERGHSIREVARRLGRAPSTVSREVRRNLCAHDHGVYDAHLAHARARQAARREREGVLAREGELRALVQDKLEQQWSPQQIAAWLKREYPDRTEWQVCHETIYQAIYFGGKRGLSRELTAHLRTGRPLRKRRRQGQERSPRYVAPGKLIGQRPAVVEERSRIGDLEGDLIVGRLTGSAIGTLVDRTSRLVRLVHVPAGHRSEAFAAALTAATASWAPAERKTLTWDQGGEMAHHHTVADLFTEGIYFAPPGTPWLRGTNENTNGLLRQYFPKSTDLRVHPPAELRRVENLLNNRPRDILDGRTPLEVHKALLTQ